MSQTGSSPAVISRQAPPDPPAERNSTFSKHTALPEAPRPGPRLVSLPDAPKDDEVARCVAAPKSQSVATPSRKRQFVVTLGARRGVPGLGQRTAEAIDGMPSLRESLRRAGISLVAMSCGWPEETSECEETPLPAA